MDWITGRNPTKRGVYLVTVLNREWTRGEDPKIIDGAEPPKDELWEDHKNLFGQLPDGRWTVVQQRVYGEYGWSGYNEKVIAWMPLPEPYTGRRSIWKT